MVTQGDATVHNHAKLTRNSHLCTCSEWRTLLGIYGQTKIPYGHVLGLQQDHSWLAQVSCAFLPVLKGNLRCPGLESSPVSKQMVNKASQMGKSRKVGGNAQRMVQTLIFSVGSREWRQMQ